MLQIGICDDDVHMLTYLSSLCSRILPESRCWEYKSGRELLTGNKDFDIILMDIEMKEMDGLEVIKQLHSRTEPSSLRRPAVIFITAFDKYVFDALDLYAFHYLLKPLNAEKFQKVLLMAAAECRNIKKESAIFFHTKSSHLRLFPSQIYYVESNLRKVIIHTQSEAFEIYATMTELEGKLGEHFFRCHRGYFVNLGKIKQYYKQGIQLMDGTHILLSKTKYPSFVEAYMNYLKRGE